MVTLEPSVKDEIVSRLKAVPGVRKIVLFGSHARGQAGPDSDIDLWIEIDSELTFFKRHGLLRERLYGILSPFDLYPVTPAEAERQAADLHSITSEVKRSGVVWYEA
jgi:predicted nucleotidyltransferase